MKIAIDGPAAAGKSTVAKQIAKSLKYVYIDTGAMYRALTLAALENGIDLEDENLLGELSKEIDISFENSESGQQVFIDHRNVTEEIRDHQVTNNVSIVAKHKFVRNELVNMQRQLAEKGNVVMDGRDIGTNVLPDAEKKFFLIASVDERAERRHKENLEKGFSSDIESLKDEIRRRDQLDSERETDPLVMASDAIEIDTTSLTIEEVVQTILDAINTKTQ
ncbi:(d)CMP kinase [Halalkalibacillus sediminis]|uniref:Cytidylate kinase n=1 Tax=Halalkalibacillus sediminis TaxID=2018042 RepID=A0A2I0QWZ6_9BACI|nr:(d)CMP kinase [Halalkalibacillus sediminis]PKR78863.1 (d)CMP kinase [Halalkalibacillus sediminis]